MSMYGINIPVLMSFIIYAHACYLLNYWVFL